MDRLYRPWRLAYVSADRPAGGEPACVFCSIATAEAEDESLLVLGRFATSFVVLNAYPYNTGHLMIVPYRHVARLSDLAPETLAEMADLASRAERALEAAFRCDGLNLGMNLGRSAGAGIADHLHLHVVPRWSGDTNFMTVIGESRVLPEELAETFRRLHGRLG